MLPAAALEVSAAVATALGLSTAPWADRTLEDKLLVAGAELGVSLRSTRGATLGVEEGGGEEAEVAAPLAGVAWPAAVALESGMAAAGGAMLEVRVVVSLVGLFCAVAKVSVTVSELVVPVVTEGSMSSTVAAVSAGCLWRGQEQKRKRDDEGCK